MDEKTDRYFLIELLSTVGAKMARLLFETICIFLTSVTPALRVVVRAAVSMLTTLIVTLAWKARDIG